MMKTMILANQLLDEIDSGILAFDETGALIFINQYAAQLLTLSTKKDLGKKYAELFQSEIPNTALFQILDRSFSLKKDSQQRLVSYQTFDGITLGLTISTKHTTLKTDSMHSKAKEGVLLLVEETGVSSSIAGDQELMQAKFEKLQQAYTSIEEQNRELKHHIKKIEWLRIFITISVFVVFIALIWYTRQSVILPERNMPVFVDDATDNKIVAVKADTIEKEIILSGRIEPHRKVTLAAQSNGKIIRKNFIEGQMVGQNHILYELDRQELVQQVRRARVTYMELVEKFNGLKDWENSLEVMQARRKLDLSKIALNDERKKLDETRKLFKKGIIPRIEYEQAQTRYKKQEYDYQNAEQSLEQIESRGNSEKVEVLRLQLSNAKEDLDELEQKYEGAVVRSPVRGVIMRPQTSDGATLGFKNEGDLVKAGDLMATIGATDAYILQAGTGELAAQKLRVGQKVSVSSYAFPGTTVDAKVDWVATEPVEAGDFRYFPVRLVIPGVPDSLRGEVRLGVLAEARIVIEKLKNVLCVPIDAVFRYQEENHVFVVDSTGQKQLRKVSIGYANFKQVVIDSGLVLNEKVLVVD